MVTLSADAVVHHSSGLHQSEKGQQHAHGRQGAGAAGLPPVADELVRCRERSPRARSCRSGGRPRLLPQFWAPDIACEIQTYLALAAAPHAAQQRTLPLDAHAACDAVAGAADACAATAASHCPSLS